MRASAVLVVFVALTLAGSPTPAPAEEWGGIEPGVTTLDAVRSPLQLHFGGSDAYIPREDVAAVERAVAGRDRMEIHVQEDGGHAFHNRKAPMFHQPEPAERAVFR